MVDAALLSLMGLGKAESAYIPDGYVFAIVITMTIFAFAMVLLKEEKDSLILTMSVLAAISAFAIGTVDLSAKNFFFGVFMVVAMLPYAAVAAILLRIIAGRIGIDPPDGGDTPQTYY